MPWRKPARDRPSGGRSRACTSRRGHPPSCRAAAARAARRARNGRSRLSMTPNGHAGTQYPQPLQMSSCTTTVPNSVRNSDPVGQASRQPACVQCLQTSDSISQRIGAGPSVRGRGLAVELQRLALLDERDVAPAVRIQLDPCCRSSRPVHSSPSAGSRLHSLHATSHALQPMQTLVSVKKPTRGCASAADRSTAPCSRRASPRRSATNWASFAPRGRRPGRMSHVSAFTSWMCTFGSSARCVRSFAAPPAVSPRWPQW